MKKILASLLFISLTATSCSYHTNGYGVIKGNKDLQTEIRDCESYDIIDVSGSFRVELVSGQEGTIKVSAESNLLPYIETESRGGRLEIKFKNGHSYSPNQPILVEVPVEHVHSLNLTGSGDIIGNKRIKSEVLRLELVGSGDINLDIETKELNSRLSGSGDILLRGHCNDMNARVTGSGEFMAQDLVADYAEVNVSGSGDMKINVKESIEARVIGSGDIRYYGEPAKEIIKVTGSGDIKALSR